MSDNVNFSDPGCGPTELNAIGLTISDSWTWLSWQYPYVDLDEFVVMPNHLHGIICLSDRGAAGRFPTTPTEPMRRKPLGRLVAAFKTVSTNRVKVLRHAPADPLWQRDYYDRVIRGDEDLNRVRQYIIDNPASWLLDRLNPDNR